MLEMQAIAEKEGYDEDEISEICDIYGELEKHIGFEDKRKDKRYVVKFHDIFYYTPNMESDEMLYLFDLFCQDMYENIDGNMSEYDKDRMFSRIQCGHYPAFEVDILEITKDNLPELSMKIFDEVEYFGAEYVDLYIKLVNDMQDLEDNYMIYWIDFLENNMDQSEKTIEQIKFNMEKK